MTWTGRQAWWQALRERWELYNQVWDRVQRAQNPWEQEGPLRWARRYGRGWELHGATLGDDEPVRRGR